MADTILCTNFLFYKFLNLYLYLVRCIEPNYGFYITSRDSADGGLYWR
jgi:hypothetical protein